MIDLHCHLLWDMDDGPDFVEQSMGLCQNAVDNDIKIIAATSHLVDISLLEDFLLERNQKIAELRRLLKVNELPLQICGGAELFLHESVFESDNLDLLTLNHSKYLLCEFPLRLFAPERAVILTEEVLERGLIPIIAHPERYQTFHRYPDVVEELADLGALFQVNAESLAGQLDFETQLFAMELLVSKTADFIATDAHDTKRRNNSMQEMLEIFPSEITPEMVKWTTITAPKLVLQNADIYAEKNARFNLTNPS